MEDIASMQDKAALATLGIDVCNSDSSDDETIPEAHCPLTPEMLGFNPHQISLIKQSHDALKDDSITQLGAERSLEGFLVTDSECENVDVVEPLSESGKRFIAIRRKIIQRQKRRLRAKAIAEMRLLSQKNTE